MVPAACVTCCIGLLMRHLLSRTDHDRILSAAVGSGGCEASSPGGSCLRQRLLLQRRLHCSPCTTTHLWCLRRFQVPVRGTEGECPANRQREATSTPPDPTSRSTMGATPRETTKSPGRCKGGSDGTVTDLPALDRPPTPVRIHPPPPLSCSHAIRTHNVRLPVVEAKEFPNKKFGSMLI